MKALDKLKELHAKSTQGNWWIVAEEVSYESAAFVVEAHKMVPRIIEALKKCMEQRDSFGYDEGLTTDMTVRFNKELEQILEGNE